MKAKLIACALACLMLMSSCVVYHKAPVTIDEAVATNERVKVISTTNEKYTFQKLVREEGKIYGITSVYSKNARTFAPHVKEIYQNDKSVEVAKILLPFEIKETYTKNKSGSTISTLVVVLSPVIVLAGAIGIAAASGGIY